MQAALKSEIFGEIHKVKHAKGDRWVLIDSLRLVISRPVEIGFFVFALLRHG